jgi:hypothetical protein
LSGIAAFEDEVSSDFFRGSRLFSLMDAAIATAADALH